MDGDGGYIEEVEQLGAVHQANLRGFTHLEFPGPWKLQQVTVIVDWRPTKCPQQITWRRSYIQIFGKFGRYKLTLL